MLIVWMTGCTGLLHLYIVCLKTSLPATPHPAYLSNAVSVSPLHFRHQEGGRRDSLSCATIDPSSSVPTFEWPHFGSCIATVSSHNSQFAFRAWNGSAALEIAIHDNMHWFLIYWHPLTLCFTMLGSSEWKHDVCFLIYYHPLTLVYTR